LPNTSKKTQHKTTAETAKILHQEWFCCHPQPLCCITGLGTEFQELLRSYGVQPKIVEHVRQTLGNMILTYKSENFEFDYNFRKSYPH
jgi:hypothetical protein